MLGVGDAANIVSQCDSVNSGISQRAFLNSSHIAELVIERLCNGQFMNTPKALANFSPGFERSENPGTA
jgi:hypothetical protein